MNENYRLIKLPISMSPSRLLQVLILVPGIECLNIVAVSSFERKNRNFLDDYSEFVQHLGRIRLEIHIRKLNKVSSCLIDHRFRKYNRKLMLVSIVNTSCTRNHETCFKAGFTVSDFNFFQSYQIDHLVAVNPIFGFLIDNALNLCNIFLYCFSLISMGKKEQL